MILLTILVLLSLLSPVVSLHRYPRQSASCSNDKNVDPYYDGSHCEKFEVCKKPKADLNCPNHYTLHYSMDESDENWIEVLAFRCDAAGKYSVNDGPNTVYPSRLSCRKDKGCELQNYPLLPCSNPKEECEMPQFASDVFTCTNGQFEAMGQWSSDEWKEVKSMKCNAKGKTETTLSGDSTSKEGGVYAMRCMKLVADNFYSPNECKTADEICEKPISWSPTVTCKADFTLQIKIGSDWTEVQQASLDVNKFTGTLVDLSILPQQPEWIRCARKRCSTCSNPCQNCASTAFKKSEKWNECAGFTCGSHSRTLVQGTKLSESGEQLTCIEQDNLGTSKWNKILEGGQIDTNGGDVMCETLCTLKTPLTTTCEADDYLCDTATLTIDDDAMITCPEQIVHKSSVGQRESVGTQIDCDKTNGDWKLKDVGGTDVQIAVAGNVYCRYKDCDSTKLCPLCVTETPGKILCPPEHYVEIQDSPSDPWRSLPNAAVFLCKLGKWKDEAGTDLKDTANVKCDPVTTTTTTTTTTPAPVTENPVESTTKKDKISSAQQAGLGTVSCVLIVFALLVILILIICLVCKLRGKGWLHTIIISKLRGGKSKDAASKAGTSKNTTSGQLNGVSPRADSPAVSGKTTAKEGDEEEEGTATGATVGFTEGTEGTENGTTFEV